MKKLLTMVVIVVVVVGAIGFGVSWWTDPMRKELAKTARARSIQREDKKALEKELDAEARVRGPLDAVDVATTQRERDAQMLDFFQRMTVESYRERGQRSPQWDEHVFALLELLAEYLVPTGKKRDFDSDAFLAAAEAVLATECEDGMAMFGAGVALFDAGRFEEADECLVGFYQDDVDGRIESPDPRGGTRIQFTHGPRHSGAMVWANRLYMRKVQAVRPASCVKVMLAGPEQVVDPFCDGVSDPRMKPGDERLLFTWFAPEIGGDLSSAAPVIVAKLERKPGLDLWLKSVLLGVAETQWAWSVRGSGWASEVTEQGWKGFGEHLKKAREHLLRACELRPEYPEAAAAMIPVAMGGERGQSETPRTWFDRAVEIQFDYAPAYSRLASALSPRWGGSHEEMLALGAECVDSGCFDTEVPGVYWGIVTAIGEDIHERGPEVWQQEEVYEKLVQMFEGMLSEPQSPWSDESVRLTWAGAAWRSGHYADMLRVLDELDDDGMANASYAMFGADMRAVRGESLLRIGPHAQELAEALALAESDPKRAQAMFEQVARAQTDPDARSYARGWALRLKVRQALSGDDWVDITPDLGLAGWWQHQGEWTARDDGSIEAIHTRLGTRLVFDEPVEGNFEVVVEATIPEQSPQGSAGVMFNFMRFNVGCWGCAQFAVYRHLYDTNLVGWRIAQPEKTETPPRIDNTFRVQVWGERLTCVLNGDVVFENRAMPHTDAFSEPTRIGIGAEDEDWGGVAAIYRSVRVRRLTSAPDWFSDDEPVAETSAEGED